MGWSFPRKMVDIKKMFARVWSQSEDWTHGCCILPWLDETKCASQERATKRCDFPRIAARKFIFSASSVSSTEARFELRGRTDNSKLGAAAIWPGGNARAKFRALTLACTTPSPLGRIRASPPGRSVLRPEQGTEQGLLPLHATQELQQKPVPSKHKETPGNTQATATAHYTHSTLLKSSNRPMAAARRRQGHQLYAWHGTPSKSVAEVIQPQPLALPLEAWPCECNTNKAKQPKRDKVFLNTTHCWGVWAQSVSAQPKYVDVCLHECMRMCRRVRTCAYVHMHGHCAGACVHVPRWCVRCLLITERPKTPCHYRYQI